MSWARMARVSASQAHNAARLGHEGLALPGKMWYTHFGVVVIAVRKYLVPIIWMGAVVLAAALVVLMKTTDVEAAAPGETASPTSAAAAQPPLGVGDLLHSAVAVTTGMANETVQAARQPHLTSVAAPATKLSPVGSNRPVTPSAPIAVARQELRDTSGSVSPTPLTSAVPTGLSAGAQAVPGTAGSSQPTAPESAKLAIPELTATTTGIRSQAGDAPLLTRLLSPLTPLLNPLLTPVTLLGSVAGVLIPLLPSPLDHISLRGLVVPGALPTGGYLAGVGQAGSARTPAGLRVSTNVRAVLSSLPGASWRGHEAPTGGLAAIRSVSGAFGGGFPRPPSGAGTGASPASGFGLLLLVGVSGIVAHLLVRSRHLGQDDRLRPLHLISLIEHPG